MAAASRRRVVRRGGGTPPPQRENLVREFYTRCTAAALGLVSNLCGASGNGCVSAFGESAEGGLRPVSATGSTFLRAGDRAGGRDPEVPKLRLGNLEAYRDWGYAGDYVEAMWMMLQQEIPDDYVICTGETHTIREFLDVAFRQVGVEDWSNFVVIDPEFYRPAEVDYLRGDNTKAKSKLGWNPRTTFEDLITLMVEADIE